jgi:Galactose oxidase, central domain
MRYLTHSAAPVFLMVLSAIGLSACGSSSSVPDDSLGGTVNGLQAGNSLVLQNNGGDNLTVAQSGNFTFPNGFAPGSSYAVTILTQPAGQTCVVVNGSGELPGAVSVLAAPGAHGVSDIVVNCSVGAGPFTVSGTVAGLLPGNAVVLQDNGGNNTTVSANGGFAFSTALAGGTAYAVTVLTQPPGQNCAISNGSGAAILANVANIAVVCSDNTFNISAVVSGLLASHSLVLQLNGANNLTVSANGTATFNAPIASGSTYAVTVLTQPTGESCTVTNGAGTVTAANITNVAVTCSPTTYTVGGTVSGLTGTVVLQDNAADNLSVTANGSFVFNTPVASGSGYAVTVLTQQAGQACAVSNGTGSVVSANVTNVTVTCTTGTTTAGLWTWESGLDVGDGPGVYGTLGTPAPGNVPGARHGPVSWVDAANNLWLFGGRVQQLGVNDDLWEYNQATGLWTWQSGSSVGSAPGNYGTQGVPAPGNVPGAREYPVSWTDAAGNFWLFGGNGYGAVNTINVLNDLWRYTPSTGLWTWMSGSSSVSAFGVYGTQGTAAVGNTPGARKQSITWTDKAGNLWLFGGSGNSADDTGQLDDLWRYSTSTGLWTWVGGSTHASATGVYGTLGTAAAGNAPGARSAAVSWTDPSGNLWLFGGSGYASPGGQQGTLNDLWHYSPTTGLWTWISGSNVTGANGVYGTQGTGVPGNTPGARQNALSWADGAGNLWLFGGFFGGTDDFNDLWKYSPATGLWTWTGGSNEFDQPGVYGPLGPALGVAAPGNIPGARDSSTAWVDGTGNFWLLGGSFFVSGQAGAGNLNDLWKYTPPGP